MRKVLILLLFSCAAQAQVVVHINAEFNKSNDWYALDQLEDARLYSGYLEKNPEIKEKYGITKVPTLILYKDGKEIQRWEAALDMKLHVTRKEIQQAIDEL